MLCCDIYRSTLISVMCPACMIIVHDRKSRALHHSFCGESCIRECGVVYGGILMRSLLVSSLHSIFSSRNRHYELILMGSIDLISGMASKTLFKSWQV